MNTQYTAAQPLDLDKLESQVQRAYMADARSVAFLTPGTILDLIAQARTARLNTTASASIEALAKYIVERVRQYGEFRNNEAAKDVASLLTASLLSSRRTPAATTGELPPLPDGDEYSATRILANGELAPRFTATSMQSYARAAIEADRAKQAEKLLALDGLTLEQAYQRGRLAAIDEYRPIVDDLRDHKIASVNAMDYEYQRWAREALNTAPASAQPADPWHAAILAECMRVESCYHADDSVKTIKELIDWHVQEAASIAETIKVQSDNYMRLTCGAQPDQNVNTTEKEPK